MSTNTHIVTLRDVVVRVIRMLLDRGIEVTQNGTRAFCAWDRSTGELKRINIPQIPDDADADFIRAIHGFIDHEVAHVLFTDSELLTSWARDLQSKAMKGDISRAEMGGRQKMQNIIEDVYIEHEIRKLYRGSKDNLDNVASWVCLNHTDMVLQKAEKDGNDQMILKGLVVAVLRTLGGAGGWDVLQDRYPEHWDAVMKFLGRFEEELMALDSTQAAIELSGRVYELCGVPPEQPQGQETSDGDDEQNQDESGENSGDSDGGEKGDKEDCEEEGEPEEKEGESEEGESDGDEGQESGSDEEESSGDDAGDEEGNDEAEGSDGENDGESGGEESDSGDSDEPENEEGSDQGDEDDESEGSSEGESGAGPDDDSDEGDEEGSSGDDDGMSAENGGDGGDDEDTTDDIDDDGGEDGDRTDEPGYGADEHMGLSEEDMEDLQDSDEAMEEALKDYLDKHFEDLDFNKGPFVPVSTDADYLGPYHPSARVGSTAHRDFLEAAESRSHVLQSQFERLFAAQNLVAWQTRLRKGRLHGAALHRLATNDNRVFRKRIESKTMDCAVTLLNDCSGSMCGSRIHLAMTSSLIFSKMLTKMNVAHEVLGFTTGVGNSKYHNQARIKEVQRRITADINKEMMDSSDRAAFRSRFSRLCPMMTLIFKPFEKRLGIDDEMNMADMGITDGNGIMWANADGDSLLEAGHRLLTRKEPRKIMIVLSDGLPASGADKRSECGNLVNAIASLERQGIEMFGIGIESQSVRNFYPNYEVLNSADELPELIIGKMRDYLIK